MKFEAVKKIANKHQLSLFLQLFYKEKMQIQP